MVSGMSWVTLSVVTLDSTRLDAVSVLRSRSGATCDVVRPEKLVWVKSIVIATSCSPGNSPASAGALAGAPWLNTASNSACAHAGAAPVTLGVIAGQTPFTALKNTRSLGSGIDAVVGSNTAVTTDVGGVCGRSGSQALTASTTRAADRLRSMALSTGRKVTGP